MRRFLFGVILFAAIIAVASQDADAEDCATVCSSEGGGAVEISPKPEESEGTAYPAWFGYCILLFLIMMSGLFSGLTLGLMGLDKIGLDVVIGGDNKMLAKCAKKVQPLREDGNLLLATLLLGNVGVNALLAQLMAELFDPTVGFVLSTSVIVIFGEIVPQATCSRYALQIGAKAAPIVRVIICLLYVICKPIGLVLDKLLGDDIGTVHSRSELRELMRIHEQEGAVDKATAAVIDGALKFREIAIKDIMTPIEHVKMLHTSTQLNFKTMLEIFRSGFSRIPVYGKDQNDVVGLVLTKDLVVLDPEDSALVGQVMNIFNRSFEVFEHDQTLGEVYAALKRRGAKSHMGIVRQVIDPMEKGLQGDPYRAVIGVVTLEDILEEIIQAEIVDETDEATVLRDEMLKSRTSKFLKVEELDARFRERLEADEAAALVAHLTVNVPHVQWPPAEAMRWLVRQMKIVRHKRLAPARTQPGDEDWLYRKGQKTDECTIVLDGTCNVIAGQDGFMTEAGRFAVLGAGVLLAGPHAEEYAPDFSAYLESETVRVAVITKEMFEAAVRRGAQSSCGDLPDDCTAEVTAADFMPRIPISTHSGPLVPRTTSRSQVASLKEKSRQERVAVKPPGHTGMEISRLLSEHSENLAVAVAIAA